MDDYRKPYLILFNAITDALALMERRDYGQAEDRLIKAQQDAEENFIGEARKRY